MLYIILLVLVVPFLRIFALDILSKYDDIFLGDSMNEKEEEELLNRLIDAVKKYFKR